MSLEKAITQVSLTADTVDDQYCSDWLKLQIKNLFANVQRLESQLGDLREQHASERRNYERRCAELQSQLAAAERERESFRDNNNQLCDAIARLESRVKAVEKERDFWAEECKLLQRVAECLEHALEIGCFTPGGSTEAWAKEALADAGRGREG